MKKGKLIICNNCGQKIEDRYSMEYIQEGIMSFDLKIKDNQVLYDYGEFTSDNSGNWLCANCGEDLGLSFEEGEKYYLNLKK